jgi:hypothetical protein
MGAILGIGTPSGFEWLVILVVFIFVFGVPATAIGLLIAYLLRNEKEKRHLKNKIEDLNEEVDRLKTKKIRSEIRKDDDSGNNRAL